jgi:hypothetical protein
MKALTSCGCCVRHRLATRQEAYMCTYQREVATECKHHAGNMCNKRGKGSPESEHHAGHMCEKKGEVVQNINTMQGTYV